jgi:hypothetical protein
MLQIIISVFALLGILTLGLIILLGLFIFIETVTGNERDYLYMHDEED